MDGRIHTDWLFHAGQKNLSVSYFSRCTTGICFVYGRWHSQTVWQHAVVSQWGRRTASQFQAQSFSLNLTVRNWVSILQEGEREKWLLVSKTQTQIFQRLGILEPGSPDYGGCKPCEVHLALRNRLHLMVALWWFAFVTDATIVALSSHTAESS